MSENYQLTCLVSTETNEQKLAELGEFLKNLTQASQNTEAKKISLAYPIKNQKDVFLVNLLFESVPEKIIEIKEKLEKMPEIIRFLLIRKLKPSLRKVRVKKEIIEKEDKKPEKKKTKKPAKADLEKIEEDLEKILA